MTDVAGRDDTCPECGAARIDAARLCPSCQYDFESFTARYRGSPWESATARAYLRAQERPAPPPPITVRPLLKVGVVVVALSASVALALLFGQDMLDEPLSDELVFVQGVFVFFLGGMASLVVPGRRARGPFLSWFVGLAGWWILAFVLLAVTGWEASYASMRGGIEGGLVSVAGAMLLRLVLLAIE